MSVHVAVLITDRPTPDEISLSLKDIPGVLAGDYSFRVGVINRTPANFKEYVQLAVMRGLIARGLIIGKEIP